MICLSLLIPFSSLELKGRVNSGSIELYVFTIYLLGEISVYYIFTTNLLRGVKRIRTYLVDSNALPFHVAPERSWRPLVSRDPV